jgi:hypothetical protein
MPLILAIEPDPRQAAQIAAIARHRVGAELMLAGTTEQALDVIGDRVPDLVLVPALLSPQDDAALAAALRVIAAAAHVRTLTIPVLATGPKKRARNEGMLAKWRRGGKDSPEAPDGCDPAIFAEQISDYLREAAAERAALAALEPEYEPELTPAADMPVAFADLVQEFAAEEPAGMPAMVDVTTYAAVEPVVEPAVMFEAAVEEPTDDLKDEELPVFPVFDREPMLTSSDAPIAAEATEWAAFDLSERLGGAANDPLFEDGADMGAHILDEALDEAALLAIDDPVEIIRQQIPQQLDTPLETRLETMPAPVEAIPANAAAAADEDNATIAEIFAALRTVDRLVVREQRAAAPAPKPHVELWMPLSLSGGFRWPRIEGVTAEFIDPRELARQAAAERAARAAQKAEPAKPEWSALIASLRKDIERLRGENQTSKPASAAPRAPKPAPVAVRPSADAAAPKPKPRAPKPAQDEWGFFDPEQCGFAALLAKLNEITETGDDPDARTH